MPIKTDIRNWDSIRPDYWAGERGGRPIPRSPSLPKKGDKLPRNFSQRYTRAFLDHSDAVEYAKMFEDHVAIKVKVRHNEFDVPYKLFIVSPRA